MAQYSQARFDASFGALSDATRRGVPEQVGRADASITGLAERFHMTLTGMKKHVGVLEQAGLVSTEKVGRVRTCKLGLRGLEEEPDTNHATLMQHTHHRPNGERLSRCQAVAVLRLAPFTEREIRTAVNATVRLIETAPTKVPPSASSRLPESSKERSGAKGRTILRR